MPRIDNAITSEWAQRISLLLLRVTTGFLLIWVGLNKIMSGKTPFAVRRNFEVDESTGAILGLAAGGAEAIIGVLCVIGLLRRFVLPMQALINGFTAASVW